MADIPDQFDRAAVMADVLALTGRVDPRVADLIPGDLVTIGDHSATFITSTEHPIWPHLRLVIWRTDESLGLPGNWSHDALDSRQEVGTVTPSTPDERAERLRGALLGGVSRA